MRAMALVGWLALVSGCFGLESNPTPPPTNCRHIGTFTDQTMDFTTTCVDDAAAAAAHECFAAAWDACEPATLTSAYGGIDSVITHTYTIRSTADACVVDLTIDDDVVSRPQRSSATCSGNPLADGDCLSQQTCKFASP